MAPRQQMGDIFLGITPAAIRQYMLQAFKGALDRYDRIIIPCAGRFTLAEAAIDAGWQPEEIECSDVSLFSSILGYCAAGKDLDELGTAFSGELDEFPRIFRDIHSRDAQACARDWLPGAVLLGIKLCQLKGRNLFEKQARREIWDNRARYHAELQEQVGKLTEKLRGISYEIRDVTQHAEQYKDD